MTSLFGIPNYPKSYPKSEYKQAAEWFVNIYHKKLLTNEDKEGSRVNIGEKGRNFNDNIFYDKDRTFTEYNINVYNRAKNNDTEDFYKKELIQLYKDYTVDKLDDTEIATFESEIDNNMQILKSIIEKEGTYQDTIETGIQYIKGYKTRLQKNTDSGYKSYFIKKIKPVLKYAGTFYNEIPSKKESLSPPPPPPPPPQPTQSQTLDEVEKRITDVMMNVEKAKAEIEKLKTEFEQLKKEMYADSTMTGGGKSTKRGKSIKRRKSIRQKML